MPARASGSSGLPDHLIIMAKRGAFSATASDQSILLAANVAVFCNSARLQRRLRGWMGQANRKMAKAGQSFFSASSSSADADAEPTLLHLPDELWIECILRNGKDGTDGERLGASELVRLRRVSRAAWRIAREAKLEATVVREKDRRARAQHDDRERRKRLNRLNHPSIVTSALAGDMAAVIAALDSGVAVDSCATWVESEEKMGGYDKEWTWSSDTALSMACSQVSE